MLQQPLWRIFKNNLAAKLKISKLFFNYEFITVQPLLEI